MRYPQGPTLFPGPRPEKVAPCGAVVSHYGIERSAHRQQIVDQKPVRAHNGAIVQGPETTRKGLLQPSSRNASIIQNIENRRVTVTTTNCRSKTRKGPVRVYYNLRQEMRRLFKTLKIAA